MVKNTPQRRARRSRPAARSSKMVFGRRNYILLGIGVALVVVGYLIMRAENEVKGFISLYVAPLMILAGYLEIMYAILAKKREEPRTAEAPAA